MRKTAQSFRVTFVGFGIAIVVALAALIGNIDLIEFPLAAMARIERNEIDEIMTSLLLLGLAIIVDWARDRRRTQQAATLENERLRVLRVTMRTVQDIVNNCLNQLQLLRLDAEDHVPAESLRLFDNAIHETSGKLQVLGDLKAFTEKQMGIGMGLDDAGAVL